MSSVPTYLRRTAPFLAGILIGVIGTATAATLRGSDVFSDVTAGVYFDEAVGEMYDLGVIKGNPDGTFNPGGFATRADIAVMLQRLRNELTGKVVASSSRSSRSTASTTSSSSSSSSSTSSVYNPKGALRFTTAEFRVPENVSTKKITIAVVRTGGNEGSGTVEYELTSGTATSGSDYENTSGTLTFANKETSKTFDIQIKDDSTSEGNETVTITLKNAVGVSLGTPSTVSLIITDDESPSSNSNSSSSSSKSTGPTVGFSAAQYSVNENAGTVTITVARTGSTSGTASVNYATSDGTADGNDYTGASGTLSFAAGESSKTFTVTVKDDDDHNGNRTVNLKLTNGVNVTLDLASSYITINDNESLLFGTGSFKFSKSTYPVTEGSGNAAITVQRIGGSSGTASRTYSTTSGTASSGNDYTHTSGTLTFAPGEASKIINVPITKDSIADTGEIFYMDLTSPTNNATLTDPFTTTISIE